MDNVVKCIKCEKVMFRYDEDDGCGEENIIPVVCIDCHEEGCCEGRD